jgi:NAD-specific glutamate dehydrogenase
MRDLQRYWQEIRAIENGLPQFVWVIAEDCLIEVARALAARLLHSKSHRLATEEEIKARQARAAEAKKQADTEMKRREGVEIVEV